ncbi:MAG: MFS transporter [Sphingobacterium sp.]
MTTAQNRILILASVGTFVEALDIAIINLTIPAIQEQFAIDNDTVQWLQTLYVLFFGGFLIIGGKLTDQIGRRAMFLWGSSLFLLASLGAGLANEFISLAVFRALQGLGAALLMPASLALVTHTFQEPKARSRAIGIFSSFAAIGSGAGLSVGGLISTYWSWHWVFLINVPILGLTLLAALKFLPKDIKLTTKNPSDIFSGIILVLALLLLTFGLHDLIHFEERPYIITGCFIVSILLISIFIRRLHTHATPLIQPQIFNNISLIISNIAFFLLGALFIGFLFLVSLLLQKDLNYSAASAGLMLVPFSILSALIAKFAIPTITDRFTTPQVGILGMGFMFAGAAALFTSIYVIPALPFVLFGAACISGIGMTLCFTSLSVLGVKDVAKENYGIASSLTSTTYFLGAGIGLSIMTLVDKLIPSNLAASPVSLIVLGSYAMFGIGLLVFLNYSDNRKISPAPSPVKQAVSSQKTS